MRNIFVLVLMVAASHVFGWGFFAHKKINRHAVFMLPPGMFGFYKANIESITEWAVKPDNRRYIIKEEAARHYMDIDVYRSMGLTLPLLWKDAIVFPGEDSMQLHGIVPWHILLMMYKLTEAMKSKDGRQILKLSADIGHYIGDAHVPLHTTSNYNGQKTGQHGIHGLWETRLPEIYFEEYDLLTGKSEYLEKPSENVWNAVFASHTCVDSVLSFEQHLTKNMDAAQKYAYEARNGQTQKVYSREFCQQYNAMLGNQVERRLKASIKLLGDVWFTCWVNAGRPDLDALIAGGKTVVAEKEENKPEHFEDCKH